MPAIFLVYANNLPAPGRFHALSMNLAPTRKALHCGTDAGATRFKIADEKGTSHEECLHHRRLRHSTSVDSRLFDHGRVR
jgi:hypothetical protein